MDQIYSGMNGVKSPRIWMHPLTLSFRSSNLQKEFAYYQTKRLLRTTRIGLILGMILYILYSFLDRQIVPQTAHHIFILRIGVCILFSIIIGVSFSGVIYRAYQMIMISAAFVAGMGIIWMIIISGEAGGIYYYAGLILAIMFTHGLLGIRFINASITTWLIVIIYEIYIFTTDVTPLLVGLNNTFFLISANFIGMFTSYALEFNMRCVFWQNRVLNEKSQSLEIEHRRKSKELDDVRQIQLAMLPGQVPTHQALDISVSMITAAEIGGDYYDFYTDGNGVLIFAVGDATGHGANASAMVTATKFIFSNFGHVQDIVEFLKYAANSLRQMKLPKLFMALVIGKIQDHTLEIAGAGMPPMFVFRESKGMIEEIPLKGVPLGGYGSGVYHKNVLCLEPGDSILVMTDGYTELMNSDGEELGYDRIRDLYQKIALYSADEIIEKLKDVGSTWISGCKQKDDITLLVIKMKKTDK